MIQAAPQPHGPGETLDILVEHLSVSYHSGGRDTLALKEIDLHVQPSEVVCLIGPSGCGKSTLLGAVAGFIKPSAGRILIGGRSVDHRVDKGVVFQEYALFPWRTAVGNVEFGLRMKGKSAKESRDIARHHLELVGLGGFADVYPHELSGGMKQRVAIARALAFDPAVLLMDEPFGALDSFTREELQKLIVDVSARTRKTILYVTHNLSEAVFLGDRVVVFSSHPGQIVEDVRVHLPQPRDPLTPEFVSLERAVKEHLSRTMGRSATPI
ncbi:MAG: ABC transporter ATP-binding protein [Candidatus Dormibacteraceae bacterium]